MLNGFGTMDFLLVGVVVGISWHYRSGGINFILLLEEGLKKVSQCLLYILLLSNIKIDIRISSLYFICFHLVNTFIQIQLKKLKHYWRRVCGKIHNAAVKAALW